MISAYRKTVAKAREFHGRYPVRSNNILRWLLEAFCLPLEVFLHNRMGIQYFHLPKAFIGFLFPFICMLLINFGISLHISILPWNLGFVRVYPVLTLPASWQEFWQDFLRTYDALTAVINNSGWGSSADLTACALLLYAIAANCRWIEQFWRERVRDVVHPRSSGNPYAIWNPVYWLMHKLNFQSDMVKLICEPLLCIGLAQLFNRWLETSTTLSEGEKVSLQFVAVWFGLGGMLLMLKAFFENRSRYVAEYERQAADQDAKAFEAGNANESGEIPMAVTPQPKL